MIKSVRSSVWHTPVCHLSLFPHIISQMVLNTLFYDLSYPVCMQLFFEGKKQEFLLVSTLTHFLGWVGNVRMAYWWTQQMKLIRGRSKPIIKHLPHVTLEVSAEL